MKFFSVLSHPYTLITCFLFIVISGEHWGGFYAMYLLMGLPHSAPHALFAVAGIFALLLGHHIQVERLLYTRLLNVVGVILLAASVWSFFYLDRYHYNWGSFRQLIPVTTLLITALVALCFLLKNLNDMSRAKKIIKV